MGTDESPELKSPLEGKPGNSNQPKPTDTMSTLTYTWNGRGTLNGNFIGASGTTASVDGVADVNGTAGMAHYGLGWMKGGHKVNPCEKYPFHMTRHWYGEDGAHIWSHHNVTGAEGAWAGDIACVGEY